MASVAPEVARRKESTLQPRYLAWSVARSGSSSRSAGSSIWMMPMPAACRSAISSRSARATWLAEVASGWSSRMKLQARMVTGPVSMPLSGLLVSDAAKEIHGTVNAAGRETSPQRIEGRVARDP